MPALYVLQSESSGRFYIGSAQDLPSRLAEHNRSHSPYTRNRGPWVLKYSRITRSWQKLGAGSVRLNPGNPVDLFRNSSTELIDSVPRAAA
jgi:hypothetical protein